MNSRVLTVAGIGVFAGLLIGGCSSPEVLKERPYIPAPADNAELVIDSTVKETTVVDVNTPPAAMPQTPPKFDTSTHHRESSSYTVKSGDSLWKIANHHNVSVQELASANNLDPKKALKVGQKLNIPGGSAKVKSSTKHADSPAPVKSAAKPASTSAKASANGGTYVVQNGDFLGKIAAKHGVKYGDLAKANNLNPPYALKVGQTLVIPAGGKAVAKSADPKSAAKTAGAKTAASKTTAAAVKPAAATTPAKAKDGKTDESREIEATTPAKSPESILKEIDLGASKTRNIEVPEDSTIDAFATKNNVSVADVKRLNPEIGADGKLKKGDIITIPE